MDKRGSPVGADVRVPKWHEKARACRGLFRPERRLAPGFLVALLSAAPAAGFFLFALTGTLLPALARSTLLLLLSLALPAALLLPTAALLLPTAALLLLVALLAAMLAVSTLLLLKVFLIGILLLSASLLLALLLVLH